ncbi:ABC transporter substrate-binding protein [Nocardiopsis sediminis]|uniref:ABC transporter substrate-binding protein n=1 Tax=Nocardiopsis sediminis TaxID=1778267 RepID=A0ABV8FLB8_9ACTN
MPKTARPRGFARALAAVAAATALAVSAAACGSGDTGEEQAGASGSGAFPRTVEHFRGEAEIPEQPARIVTLDTSYTDAAIALELEVVGRITYHDFDQELPEYLGEDGATYAGDAEIVGTQEAPDLAAIAELEPDLIVSADVRHADIYDQLSSIAPTIFSETTGATWKDNIRLLAEATGTEDLAEEKIGAYEERAAEVGAAIEDANGGEAPTISITRFAGEPTVRLYSSASFPGIVMADTGLSRPEDAPDSDTEIMVDLSQEEILDLDADQIFIGRWDDGSEGSAEKADAFLDNPLWDRLEGEQHDVQDVVWFTSVSLQGAEGILDDLEEILATPDEG